jgi:hypothetical protein
MDSDSLGSHPATDGKEGHGQGTPGKASVELIGGDPSEEKMMMRTTTANQILQNMVRLLMVRESQPVNPANPHHYAKATRGHAILIITNIFIITEEITTM